MNAIQQLLTDHIDIWTAADTEKKSGRGRSIGNAASVYGIRKLRELILELAVRGKLVPQDDEWKKLKLSDVGFWAIGSGFPTSEQGSQNDDILFAKVSDMNLAGNEKFIVTTNNTITNETAKRLKINVHTAGTVIFPKIGGAIATNKRRILIRDTAIDNNCLGLTPKAGVSTDWLYLLLSSIDLTKYQAGTSVPALAQKVLKEIPVMLPELSEQRRIVVKVDELMALCDQLETQHNNAAEAHEKLASHLLGTLTQSQSAEDFSANWQRIAAHFDTLFTTESSIDALKQILLQLAVMGKLVAQDPNDEPASELLKRILAEKAKLIAEGKIKKEKPLAEITDDKKPFKLPTNWEWARIGVLALNTEYGLSEKTFDIPEGVPVLKMGDIQEGKVVLGGQKKVDKNVNGLPELYLKSGDLLYNRTNSAELVGKTGIYEGDEGKYTFASYLIRVRCINSLVLPHYLNLVMNTPLFRKTQIEPHLKQQCGQANVNGTIMKNMIVSVPTFKEQHRIVAKIDELMALCDALKTRISEAQRIQIHLTDTIVNQALA